MIKVNDIVNIEGNSKHSGYLGIVLQITDGRALVKVPHEKEPGFLSCGVEDLTLFGTTEGAEDE